MLLTLCTALAAEGPWTVRPGQHEVYLGASYDTTTSYVGDDGEEQELPSPIVGYGAKALYQVGVAENLSLAAQVPVAHVRATDAPSDSELYEATTGLGQLSGQVRYTAIDRGHAALGARAGVRSGALHAETRDRLTNVGEGTTDAGVGLALGTQTLLGRGFLTASVDADYWYRFQVATGLDGEKLPANEITAGAMALYSFHPAFGIAGAMDTLQRLGGLEMDELSGVDGELRWVALNARNLKAAPTSVCISATCWSGATVRAPCRLASSRSGRPSTCWASRRAPSRW